VVDDITPWPLFPHFPLRVQSDVTDKTITSECTWFLSAVQLIEAYRYGNSRDGSAGMIYTRPGKCRYGIPSHTVPLQARPVIEVR